MPKPKKAQVAYIFFSMEASKEVRKTLTSMGDVSKKIGELWKALSDEDKKPYQEMAEKDVLRYQREKKEFDETGFFTNKDGVNSSTLAPV